MKTLIKYLRSCYMWLILVFIFSISIYILFRTLIEHSPKYVKVKKNTTPHPSIIKCQKKWNRLDSVFNAKGTGLLQPGHIDRIEALKNGIIEMQKLGYDPFYWEFEFFPSGYPYRKFKVNDSFDFWWTPDWDQKVKWLDGHSVWKILARCWQRNE